MATDNSQVLKIERVFAELLEELEKQPVSKQKASIITAKNLTV